MQKEGAFWNGNNKQKESHHACSAWHCHCLHLYHRSFCEKAYDRHQEELRLQAVETKNSEIDEAYQKFESEENRDRKLEALKQEMESAEQYKRQKTLMRNAPHIMKKSLRR